MMLEKLTGLERRALAAYVTDRDSRGAIPGTVRESKHEGLRYVWIADGKHVLACYRVKERERGASLLRLRRWPSGAMHS